jgi:hypothetical protein
MIVTIHHTNQKTLSERYIAKWRAADSTRAKVSIRAQRGLTDPREEILKCASIFQEVGYSMTGPVEAAGGTGRLFDEATAVNVATGAMNAVRTCLQTCANNTPIRERLFLDRPALRTDSGPQLTGRLTAEGHETKTFAPKKVS